VPSSRTRESSVSSRLGEDSCLSTVTTNSDGLWYMSKITRVLHLSHLYLHPSFSQLLLYHNAARKRQTTQDTARPSRIPVFFLAQVSRKRRAGRLKIDQPSRLDCYTHSIRPIATTRRLCKSDPVGASTTFKLLLSARMGFSSLSPLPSRSRPVPIVNLDAPMPCLICALAARGAYLDKSLASPPVVPLVLLSFSRALL